MDTRAKWSKFKVHCHDVVVLVIVWYSVYFLRAAAVHAKNKRFAIQNAECCKHFFYLLMTG